MVNSGRSLIGKHSVPVRRRIPSRKEVMTWQNQPAAKVVEEVEEKAAARPAYLARPASLPAAGGTMPRPAKVRANDVSAWVGY